MGRQPQGPGAVIFVGQHVCQRALGRGLGSGRRNRHAIGAIASERSERSERKGGQQTGAGEENEVGLDAHSRILAVSEGREMPLEVARESLEHLGRLIAGQARWTDHRCGQPDDCAGRMRIGGPGQREHRTDHSHPEALVS